ncbi:MAG: RNA methyltransferase [Chitinophagaceae bacterium]|nr:RNA methyltransferase [Chitinophagaceae bacterium]
MLTKAQVKHISSLGIKKYRQEFQQFVIEGPKMVDELLQSKLEIEKIYALNSWHSSFLKNLHTVEIIEDYELKKISQLETPNEVLAIARFKKEKINFNLDNISIALDDIQDPGNLGTIIRIADWYGINQIYCSPKTVDMYNTKTIQASMGSIFRVSIHYVDLIKELSPLKERCMAAVLNGTSIKECKLPTNGILIIGNESKGINEDLLKICNHKISIPRKGKAESLNAAIACGIICSILIE